MTRKQITALKALAEALDHKVQVNNGAYFLLQADGERLCANYTYEELLESINVYAGGHPRFKDALYDFRNGAALIVVP